MYRDIVELDLKKERINLKPNFRSTNLLNDFKWEKSSLSYVSLSFTSFLLVVLNSDLSKKRFRYYSVLFSCSYYIQWTLLDTFPAHPFKTRFSVHPFKRVVGLSMPKSLRMWTTMTQESQNGVGTFLPRFSSLLKEKMWERERKRERESVCMCLCVWCVRERERNSEP